MKETFEFFKRNARKVRMATIAVGTTMAMSVPVFATATPAPTANAAVVSAFDGIKGDIIATLGTVATAGVVILGVFLAWKYGKKLFNRVAN